MVSKRNAIAVPILLAIIGVIISVALLDWNMDGNGLGYSWQENKEYMVIMWGILGIIMTKILVLYDSK